MPWVDELNVQLTLPDPPDVKRTLVGVHDADKPDDGLTDSERVTLPAKPPRLMSVTVEDPVLPDWKPTVAGFGMIE